MIQQDDIQELAAAFASVSGHFQGENNMGPFCF